LFRKELKIHSLLDEIIKSNPNEDIWQGKSANGWYPPRDFKVNFFGLFFPK